MKRLEININSIIKDKAPKVPAWIRVPIAWIMAAIVRQKRMNECLRLYGHTKDLEFIDNILNHLNISRSSQGDQNIESGKRYLFASNHPLGGVDGFVLAERVNQHISDSKIVVNDILMNVTPVAGLFLPINKHGKQSSDYAKSLNSALESDGGVIYFPAGLCSRKVEGKITDLKWNKSFVKKAIESKRDVIPTYVDSINSKYFYNFALWRKRLKIKANIEMVLLPRELFKKENKSIKIIFGKPISYTKLKEFKNLDEAVKLVRDECYNLSNKQK